MKSYIYKMYRGADPSHGWLMSDPIFGDPATLGACVPNIRRLVEVGDRIFCISGRVEGANPYIVGGFKVKEKIDALAAYSRLPHNRLCKHENGQTLGNIIINADGTQHPLDTHDNFEKRIENYIVGEDPVCLTQPWHIARAREETLDTLSKIFNTTGNRVYDIIARWRRMNEKQAQQLLEWFGNIKQTPQPQD